MTQTFTHYRYNNSVVQNYDAMTATGNGSWVKITNGSFCLQITGTATSITYQLQRSSVDPGVGTPNPVSVGTATTINPSAGPPILNVLEFGVGWWRVVITSMTGAEADVYISGRSDT